MRESDDPSTASSDELVRAFIVHESYATGDRYGPLEQDGQQSDDAPEPATTIELWGRLESGDSFLILEDRYAPSCSIPKSAPPIEDRGVVRRESALRTMAGDPVDELSAATSSQLRAVTDRLQRAEVATFESDLRPVTAFRIRHQIGTCFQFRDRSSQAATAIARGVRVDRVYRNVDVERARFSPPLRVLSFDIETDRRASRVLSIAAVMAEPARHDSPGALRDRCQVLLWNPPGHSCPRDATPCLTQAELLERFTALVHDWDPDVITGWNIVDFDLRVLEAIAREHDVVLDLGRRPGRVRFPALGRGGRVIVPGRAVLDGIWWLRTAFVRMDSYALDHVAQQLLGEGKLITHVDRVAEIQRQFDHDREQLVAYNRRDAELVLEIIAHLDLLSLTIERSLLTGMTPDRVASSVAAFEFLYISDLRRRGYVAPTRASESASADTAGYEEPNYGGHVLEPRPGLHRNVLVFDFKSLYPSIIRSFHIDPLAMALATKGGADVVAIEAPNGARFARPEAGAFAILPNMLAELMPRRAAAKRARNEVASHAIKILMNSFYGVLGTPACRFHSSRLVNAITAFGRELLMWLRDEFEREGYDVIYGDTDSVFVDVHIDEPAHAWQAGPPLVALMNERLRVHVQDRWQAESHLELEFERLFRRLHLPHARYAARRGASGARKRYVGRTWRPAADSGAAPIEEWVFVGTEVVRRDWTELAKRVQRELYERWFGDTALTSDPRPGIRAYLRDVVQAVEAGECDAELVYIKALRRDVASYTKTTPPHVVAARLLGPKPPRLIEYVMTVDGPQPVSMAKRPIDHHHYVDKQVRPVAEPILRELGIDFREILGGPQQLELF